jgi:thioredoxin reductase (NADPH)
MVDRSPPGSATTTDRDHRERNVVTTTSTDAVEKVVIIGSGPAGYTAALYTARAQLNPVVIEGAIDGGGALMKTTDVENFPGFPEGIMGPALMESMRAQAERFGTRFVTDDAVSVDLATSPKVIRLEDGTTYLAETVIIATGSAYRYLGIDREQELLGRGVSACATCDGFFFKGREIAVIGGGDTALEEATFLTRFADKVTLVHRRDSLRASKIMQERARLDPKIEYAWNSEVVELHGDDALTGVTLRDTQTGETRLLDVTGMFVAIGHDPRSGIIKDQIDLDPEGYVLVDHPTTATNIDGVFACGDVVDHVYRQAITAAGSGCAAALDAERWLAARGEVPVALSPELTVAVAH